MQIIMTTFFCYGLISKSEILFLLNIMTKSFSAFWTLSKAFLFSEENCFVFKPIKASSFLGKESSITFFYYYYFFFCSFFCCSISWGSGSTSLFEMVGLSMLFTICFSITFWSTAFSISVSLILPLWYCNKVIVDYKVTVDPAIGNQQ